MRQDYVGQGTSAKGSRARTAGRPVQKFDGVDYRHLCPGADLHHAADVPRRDHIRRLRLERAFNCPEISGCIRL